MLEVWPFRPFSRTRTVHRAPQGPIPGGTGGSKWSRWLPIQTSPLYGPIPRCPSPGAGPFRVPSQNWQKRWPQRAWRQTGQGRGPLEILPAKDGGHLGPSPGRDTGRKWRGWGCLLGPLAPRDVSAPHFLSPKSPSSNPLWNPFPVPHACGASLSGPCLRSLPATRWRAERSVPHRELDLFLVLKIRGTKFLWNTECRAQACHPRTAPHTLNPSVGQQQTKGPYWPKGQGSWPVKVMPENGVVGRRPEPPDQDG